MSTTRRQTAPQFDSGGRRQTCRVQTCKTHPRFIRPGSYSVSLPIPCPVCKRRGLKVDTFAETGELVAYCIVCPSPFTAVCGGDQ